MKDLQKLSKLELIEIIENLRKEKSKSHNSDSSDGEVLADQSRKLIDLGESRFRELVNTINSGVAIYKVINEGMYGSDYIIEDFNAFALIHEKRQKQDVIGKSIKDLRPTIDDFGLIEVFRKVWKTGKAEFFPAQVYVDENFTNYYENRVFRLPGGEIVAVYDDVTEKKVAEKELKESKAFNETLLNASPDIIYIYDIVENKNIYSNDGIMNLLGYSTKEIQAAGGDVVQKLMHPDDFKLYLEDIIPRYQDTVDNEIVSHEYRMKHKNGEWFWLLSKELIFSRDPNGNPIQIFGILSDITDRKKAEERLKESEFKFRTLADYTSDWEYWEDENNQILYMSPSSQKITGYTENEFISKPSMLKTIVHPEDASFALEHNELFHQHEKKRQLNDIEFRIIRKDGSVVFISHVCRPIFDEENKYIGRRISNRDITKRKLIEKEVAKHQENLEELVQERTRKLEEKNIQLEKFNSLFVNREFRIKELRDELEKLKESGN